MNLLVNKYNTANSRQPSLGELNQSSDDNNEGPPEEQASQNYTDEYLVKSN